MNHKDVICARHECTACEGTGYGLECPDCGGARVIDANEECLTCCGEGTVPEGTLCIAGVARSDNPADTRG